ncbi:hypothetical protein [Vibrio sp. B1FLJ16]|uniref:hypothetical protein n=1 Tax=Vibrio sp. B1FLJ16 TaxID=2751178 RepID=UPI0015F5EFB8|nr:hypothetical protein [Vibrio sp. B1FLJ16]CAD7823287.1 hypothetical protein ACOMICROBIO_EPCKBFOG_04364 [Vibrio sp. B1FLJ16]CAE6951497.1 hypothetical protein ACOMICROBIO_EPCKBFOG_04364 [Vibrio sp. B1FLJ16]
MSVQPKHTDLPPRYETPDFTTDQRHRFTTVANAALKRRDLYKRALDKDMVGKLKQQALRPVVPSQSGKRNRARRVIWLLVTLVTGLWAMYMFS